MSMGKTKERGKYQSISLSVDFIEEIKKAILNNPNYKSVADYTRDALREKMYKGKREQQGLKDKWYGSINEDDKRMENIENMLVDVLSQLGIKPKKKIAKNPYDFKRK